MLTYYGTAETNNIAFPVVFVLGARVTWYTKAIFYNIHNSKYHIKDFQISVHLNFPTGHCLNAILPLSNAFVLFKLRI